MNCLHLSQIACQFRVYDIVRRMVQASLLQTIPLRGLCPRILAPKPARSYNTGTICRETTLAIKDFTYIFTKVHLKITICGESISFTGGVPWRRRLAGDFALCVWFKNRRRDAGAT